jgi:hypothetical protein
VALTVALAGFVLVHVTGAPAMAAPWMSRTVAVSCTVAVTSTNGLFGVMVIEPMMPFSRRKVNASVLPFCTPTKPAGTDFRSLAAATTRASARPSRRPASQISAR